MHHQCQILLLHVVKVRVIPCVHGDLLSAEQHQQLPLLFSSIKIALWAVPICVHRCSSVRKIGVAKSPSIEMPYFSVLTTLECLLINIHKPIVVQQIRVMIGWVIVVDY